jgi:alpha-1,6-mannosyltransferase
MARIVQIANFVAPHSGGIRTVLGQLSAGYAAAGHDVLQIVPGPARRHTCHEWGERLELPGRMLPGTGYRLITAAAVVSALGTLGSDDRIEVHDRTTLRGLGAYARGAGIGSVVVSHERLDRLAQQWTHGAVPTRRLADGSNRRLAAEFDNVVCTTEWAAVEFRRLDVPNLRVVPLGVDHRRFNPQADGQDRWRRHAPPDGALLAMAIRLSVEKRPAIAVEAVRELVERGRAVELLIAGDGPLRHRLERAARGLPVTFLGHIPADELAGVFAAADVVMAPGPVETFGLAALEALAAGTPVVVNRRCALPAVVGDAGRAASGTGADFADAVEGLLAEPAERIGAVARARALQFDWGRTVQGFLAVHGLNRRAQVPA